MKTAKYLTGFTLIELLVSISIVTIISSFVLFNYSDFNDRLSLTATAQDIVSMVKQAQAYAINVREASVSGGNFNYAYAVYFDTSSSDYYLFVDKNVNGRYDAGTGCDTSSTECVEKGTFKSNVVISGICGDLICPPPNATRMYVGFIRPDPDSIIYFVDSSNGYLATKNTGKVILRSPKGKLVTITIEKTGQATFQ
jgi:prepilin-type N-terminal cleavage/methylation domain-containing protein